LQGPPLSLSLLHSLLLSIANQTAMVSLTDCTLNNAVAPLSHSSADTAPKDLVQMPAEATAGAEKDALRLEDFLGEWHDSMGHQVCVKWARQGNRAGELDVELQRHHSSNNRIRLNVKDLGEGKFQCGHFELNLDKSSAKKIVWADKKIKGKVSVWDREDRADRARSRSRSPCQPRQKCGCVVRGCVVLRCKEHQPLLPPRSVLHDIATPGAWVPPKATEIIENNCEANEANEALKLAERESEALEIAQKMYEVAVARNTVQTCSEVDRQLEAYDQSLTQAETATTKPKPGASSDALQDAKAKLLVKHFQIPAAEAKEELLVPVMLASPQKRKSATISPFSPQPLAWKGRAPKGSPLDPRLRRRTSAPTGGA